jgi:hypothetical protein
MKKLLLTLSLAVLAISAFAQSEPFGIRPMNWHSKSKTFNTQSLDTQVSSDRVNLLWLRDGYSNDYTALAVPMFKVTGLGNRVSIVGLGAYDSKFSKTNLYAGTGLQVGLIQRSGWNVNVYGAYKGLNLGDNFRAAEGKGAWVFGVGLSIPISGN